MSLWTDNRDYIITMSIPEDCATPVITLTGDMYDEKHSSFEVYAEGCLVATPCDIMDAFETLVSAHYVFDIPYHKKAKCTLAFLQKGLFKLDAEGDTMQSVRSMINLISNK